MNNRSCRGCDSAQLILAIKTMVTKGSGAPEDPVRTVTEYWSLAGEKLAENDPYLGSIRSASSNASSDSM